jgi:hypothetical protein
MWCPAARGERIKSEYCSIHALRRLALRARLKEKMGCEVRATLRVRSRVFHMGNSGVG